MSTATAKGLSSLPKRKIHITFAVVIMAVFLSAMDQTVVSTALPRIVADLGGFTQYAWVATSYLLCSTISVVITGRLTDMYGRKWFYVGGLIIFILGSLLCGASQTMLQLILFRGLQGIGGGVMLANSFTIVADLFPPAVRGKYQGFTSSVFAIASIVGPLLGGYITDAISWHWVFWVNVPYGILVIVLFVRYFPDLSPARREHQVDYTGVAALTLAVVPALLAMTWGGVEVAWNSPLIIGMFVFAAVMVGIFIYVEKRSLEPIIPLLLFRNRIVVVLLVVTFLSGIGMFSSFIFLPLYFQGVLGFSPVQGGSAMIPMVFGTVIGSIISGQLLARTGGHYRIQMMAGLALVAVGIFLLSRMDAETSTVRALLSTAVMGFGIGNIMPVTTVAVQNAVTYEFIGVITSTSIFFRTIGGALGLAVLGAVISNRFTGALLGRVPEGLGRFYDTADLVALGRNPQALVSPQAQTDLLAALQAQGPEAEAMFEPLLTALRGALADSLGAAFFVTLGVVVAALVVTFFLKEIPLRREN